MGPHRREEAMAVELLVIGVVAAVLWTLALAVPP